MRLTRRAIAVGQRMFTDAEVQAVQPNVDLRVLRHRLMVLGFNFEQLRRDVSTSTYRIYDAEGVDEITWPDGMQARWAQKNRPQT